MQNYMKLSKKALSIVAPFAKIYFCKSGLSSLLFEKKSEPFESSTDLRVALSKYVPRYERIISDKQQQKGH